jgi:hypothetical protein
MPRARKTFNVTLKVVREYRASIDVRARTQAEAEKIALREYDRFVRPENDKPSQYWNAFSFGFPKPWYEHESATFDPEISTRFHCVDCGECTLSSGEYYRVDNELWAASGLGPNDGMLCLHCLERRIGRELTLDDFTAVVTPQLHRRQNN